MLTSNIAHRDIILNLLKENWNYIEIDSLEKQKKHIGENMQYRDKYDEEYYKSYLGAAPYEDPFWINGFNKMGNLIVDALHPKNSLEIGCAMGYLVAALRSKGVEAYGIDISDYAISKVAAEGKEFCKTCSGLNALPEGFPCRYDLVICIEVAEHLYPQDGELLIEKMCTYADRILFSSTADDVYEPTHHNVQRASYWAELFAKQGFYQDFAMRPQYVSPQALLFCKQDNVPQIIFCYEEALEREKKNHEDSFSALLSDRQTSQEIMDSQCNELCQLQQALQQLKDDRQKAQGIMDAQHDELCELRQASQRLKDDREKAQEIMDTQHNELCQLQQALQQLKDDREKAQEIMDLQHEELCELRQVLQQLKDDREKAQEIMDVQHDELCQLQQALRQLKDDRAKAQKIMDSQKDNIDQLSQAMDSLKDDRQKAQEIMDAQQRKINNQEEMLAIIGADRAKAQEIMETQQKKIQEQSAAFSLLQADREEAQKIMDIQYEMLSRRGYLYKIKSFLKL